jgi:hypothetical protein
MSLHQDVTFDSLGAVRDEIREWLGVKDNPAAVSSDRTAASRDMLIAVLIHSLAEEISDVRVRSQIHALLAELQPKAASRFED